MYVNQSFTNIVFSIGSDLFSILHLILCSFVSKNKSAYLSLPGSTTILFCPLYFLIKIIRNVLKIKLTSVYLQYRKEVTYYQIQFKASMNSSLMTFFLSTSTFHKLSLQLTTTWKLMFMIPRHYLYFR